MIAPLVTASWLRERLGEPGLRVVDCRYKLGEPGAGEPLWREGHIPGASHLDVDRDLAAPPGDRGRHPLPDPDAFAAAARRAGIGKDTLVVAYDEAAEGGAARLWWLLRHLGHDMVTVLDGGLRGWREEGGELRAGPEQTEPGNFRAREPETATASAEELSATLAEATEPAAADASEPAGALAARRSFSTPGHRSATAARWSRSIGSRGTFPARETCPSWSSLRRAGSFGRMSFVRGSSKPGCSPVTMPLRTAGRG